MVLAAAVAAALWAVGRGRRAGPRQGLAGAGRVLPPGLGRLRGLPAMHPRPARALSSVRTTALGGEAQLQVLVAVAGPAHAVARVAASAAAGHLSLVTRGRGLAEMRRLAAMALHRNLLLGPGGHQR